MITVVEEILIVCSTVCDKLILIVYTTIHIHNVAAGCADIYPTFVLAYGHTVAKFISGCNGRACVNRQQLPLLKYRRAGISINNNCISAIGIAGTGTYYCPLLISHVHGIAISTGASCSQFQHRILRINISIGFYISVNCSRNSCCSSRIVARSANQGTEIVKSLCQASTIQGIFYRNLRCNNSGLCKWICFF